MKRCCDAVMGKKNSKIGKEGKDPVLTTFNDAEWKLIYAQFGFGENTGPVDRRLLEETWKDFLPSTLKDTWLLYLYPEGGQSFDRGRFAYMYKAQKSKQFEIKSSAIIRILLHLNINAEVTTISYEIVSDYFLHATAAYLRGLWRYNNPEIMIWLQRQATVSVRTLKQVLIRLTAPLKTKSDFAGMITCNDLEEFCRSNRVLTEVVEELMDLAYGMIIPTEHHSLLPRISQRYSTILDVGEILFLCAHLMRGWTHFWKLRFQNKGHGSNFTMLCETIVDVGPTIIIVRDTNGSVFGCCASEAWKIKPTFYGDCRSFLFQLKPVLKHYGASIYNQNYQYHNQNQHMLPNGFGMGGVLGHCGLWLDGDFGKGFSSDYCSTFNDYRRLSSTEEFNYDHIEVWSINETYDPDMSDDDLSKKKGRSIIETDQLKNAILTMAGRQPHSS